MMTINNFGVGEDMIVEFRILDAKGEVLSGLQPGEIAMMISELGANTPLLTLDQHATITDAAQGLVTLTVPAGLLDAVLRPNRRYEYRLWLTRPGYRRVHARGLLQRPAQAAPEA